MKKTFSTAWKASSRPAKQRKYVAKAPLHLMKHFLSVHLSKDLRKKYGLRNISIKKGDTVKILRGKFKKEQGKVLRVARKAQKIYVETIQAKKRDGSKTDIPLKASNLQLIELNLEDKKRNVRLQEKSSPSSKTKENTHAPETTKRT